MKIAAFNVNSVKARLPRVLEGLSEAAPDVALLQEIKTQTEAFPYLEIEELGYNTAVLAKNHTTGSRSSRNVRSKMFWKDFPAIPMTIRLVM